MENQQHRPTLLDVPISVFRQAFDNTPEVVSTLRRIGCTGHYRLAIEAIRSEEDSTRQQDLKKQLRAFTPVAWLHHRKEGTDFGEKIGQQWPLLMGDIDQKDNPDVDMIELKRHLTRLPYVLLCAHSVRGGLWFVIRLPDNQTPDTLLAHFRYLQRLFGERLGIVLDKSKGGNPTHLRYVSYDASPYINENATVMTGQYTPPKVVPVAPQRTVATTPADETVLLTRLASLIRNAGDGQKHHELLKAARLAGGFVAGGQLSEQTAVDLLEYEIANRADVADLQAAFKTIRAGITYGLTEPIYAPERPPNRPVPHQTTRPNNTWLLKGELIHGEVIAVDSDQDYPPDWDTPTDQPAPQLLVSPNRSAFANHLGMVPNQLPLYRLTNHV